jgi:hypothetical protein
MKSNKTFSLKISFSAVGNGMAECVAWMTLHCSFREIGQQAAPMAVKIRKGMMPFDIPSQLPLSHR